MKKIISLAIVSILISSSKVKAETYATHGMLIGAGVGAAGVTVASQLSKEDCSMGCAPDSYKVAAFGLGALLGGLVGAGIGALIPRHNNFEISPIINPSKESIDVGVNLKVKF